MSVVHEHLEAKEKALGGRERRVLISKDAAHEIRGSSTGPDGRVERSV